MIFPDPSRIPPLYHEPNQIQDRAPTDYENLLADAIEAAFAAGVWELDALVARLNAEGVRMADGTPWTVESFEAEIARLAA